MKNSSAYSHEGRKIGSVDFLAQGTIYPDVIESVLAKEVIKSHHNVGGLPAVVDLKVLLIPLRNLFKDEVRELGSELGLADYSYGVNHSQVLVLLSA